MPVNRRKLRVRLLPALCVAALAVLALGAGTAQAHEWTVNGSPLSKQGGKMGISGKSGSEPINFHWTALEGIFSWSCKGASESGTIETGGVSQATLQFTSCGFVKPLGTCHINPTMEATVSTKVVEVVEGKSTKVYEAYTTAAGKGLLVKVEGRECMLAPQTWEFKGTFASLIDGVERLSQPKAFSEANQAKGGFAFMGGSAPVYIEGGWNETLVSGFPFLLS
jgi:hypothetical protein